MNHTCPKLPYLYAKQHRVLHTPTQDEPWRFTISSHTPSHICMEIQRHCENTVHWLLCDDDAILDETIATTYAALEGNVEQLASELADTEDLARLMQQIPDVEDLLETADHAPIVRMINAMLTQAAREGASDIHIEPFERHSAVRFRLDGQLRDKLNAKKQLHAALISRLKVMAQLDIAEKRLPQDGRISLRIGGKPMDVRVSTLPTAHGERAVMRLLNPEQTNLPLHTLGLGEDTLQQLDALIQAPHGMLLVTGPTGSGKTTTLYALLSRIANSSLNIMTVEDPVEYQLPGIAQTPVNSKIDMSFAKALRAILRQDPDVVMIGEIRDQETAQIAIQASLTGHLVLATLHTNSAASTITRLMDMGIEPYLLSASLLGVLAQRLVRKTCTQCHGKGCQACSNSGFLGRTGVYELLTLNSPMRNMIHNRASAESLEQYAMKHGMRNLLQDGQRWVHNGTTTEAEVLRACQNKLVELT